MGKRLIAGSSLIIFLTLMVIKLPGCSTDSADSSLVYPKGKGTESNPFHVTTILQLQAIDEPGHLDMHYIQMGDIDTSPSHEFQHGSGWKEIGSRETPFTGSYNGNGYVIRDLKLHEQRGGPSRGVWGYVKNGRIENVFVDNSNQVLSKSSDDQYQFGLNNQFLFGSNEQSIELISPTSAEIDLSDDVGIGGLVGFNDGGEIINCTFHGFVGAYISSTASGFVGINTGLIENSYATGTVIATGAEAELSAVIKTNHGSVNSIYWDMDSIGEKESVFEGSSERITGLKTDQMTGTAARQFMPEFDWDTVLRTTANYPVLWWED